jgi:hypothetical protein
MQGRLVVLGGIVVLVGVACIIQACGDTEAPAAPVDAGPDVTDTGPKEAAPEPVDSATCDLAKDFSEDIPDAAIADGASTTGLCMKCTHEKCVKAVDDCNADCPCKDIAAEGLDCYQKNSKNPLVCAAIFQGAPPATQQIGLSLFGCVNQNCKQPCATESFQNNDAGKNDAGKKDGSTDAASDADAAEK